jgi:membrane protease YdiL (CAAX protease family)
MDQCPSCGARLAGAPSWCPRCLARFDRVAPAPPPPFGARRPAASQASLVALAPPRSPTVFSPPQPTPAAEPAEAWAAAAPPIGKSPITPTVVKAIVLGLALQGVVFGLSRALHLEATSAVALGLGLTLAFYLVVLSMVQGRLIDSGLKPVWHIGPPGTGLVIGVGVGTVAAFVVIGVSSLIAGHVSSDATATIAFAQGGLVRVAMLVAISVVAAPFVEELLFRGLLAESLRGRGRGAAIWLSALAFALWHLRPDAIRYYLFCGALLGLLYWKRGLVCSMAAHATFNGTLVLVAALSLSGPAHVVNGAAVSMSAPAGWRQVATPAPGASLELRNPSGASVVVHRMSLPPGIDPASVVDRVRSSPALGTDVTVKAATARQVQYPAGAGVEVDVVDHGREVDAVLLVSPQGLVVVELATGGNAGARDDFRTMLQTLTLR